MLEFIYRTLIFVKKFLSDHFLVVEPCSSRTFCSIPAAFLHRLQWEVR